MCESLHACSRFNGFSPCSSVLITARGSYHIPRSRRLVSPTYTRTLSLTLCVCLQILSSFDPAIIIIIWSGMFFVSFAYLFFDRVDNLFRIDIQTAFRRRNDRCPLHRISTAAPPRGRHHTAPPPRRIRRRRAYRVPSHSSCTCRAHSERSHCHFSSFPQPSSSSWCTARTEVLHLARASSSVITLHVSRAGSHLICRSALLKPETFSMNKS